VILSMIHGLLAVAQTQSLTPPPPSFEADLFEKYSWIADNVKKADTLFGIPYSKWDAFWKELQTDYLLLDPTGVLDFEAFCKLIQDPKSVYAYMTYARKDDENLNDTNAYIERLQKHIYESGPGGSGPGGSGPGGSGPGGSGPGGSGPGGSGAPDPPSPEVLPQNPQKVTGGSRRASRRTKKTTIKTTRKRTRTHTR